jgi:hypothetical protein
MAPIMSFFILLILSINVATCSQNQIVFITSEVEKGSIIFEDQFRNMKTFFHPLNLDVVWLTTGIKPKEFNEKTWRPYLSKLAKDNKIIMIVFAGHGDPVSMNLGGDELVGLDADKIFEFYTLPILNSEDRFYKNELILYLHSCQSACLRNDGFQQTLSNRIAENLATNNPNRQVLKVTLIGHENSTNRLPFKALNQLNSTNKNYPIAGLLVSKIQKNLVRMNSIWMQGLSSMIQLLTPQTLAMQMIGILDGTLLYGTKFMYPLLLFDYLFTGFPTLPPQTAFPLYSLAAADHLRRWIIGAHEDTVTIDEISGLSGLYEEKVEADQRVISKKALSLYDWMLDFKRTICSETLIPKI